MRQFTLEVQTEDDYKRVTKEIILAVFNDTLSYFFYCGREEDRLLPKGRIEEAMKEDCTILEEMINMLKKMSNEQ